MRQNVNLIFKEFCSLQFTSAMWIMCYVDLTKEGQGIQGKLLLLLSFIIIIIITIIINIIISINICKIFLSYVNALSYLKWLETSCLDFFPTWPPKTWIRFLLALTFMYSNFSPSNIKKCQIQAPWWQKKTRRQVGFSLSSVFFQLYPPKVYSYKKWRFYPKNASPSTFFLI